MKKKTEVLNFDLFIVGMLFTMIVMTYAGANSSHRQEKVNKDLLVAKTITVELYQEKELLLKEKETLQKQLSGMNHLARIQKEFSQIKSKNKGIVLALAKTEADWNYNVKHPQKDTVGICGVRPSYWKKYLAERNIKINSLQACEAIYEFYLEENDGNRLKALKDYKGAKTNFASAKETLELAIKFEMRGYPI
jgi:hypothetical protein